MKHAAFRVQPERGGWLRTTLCPINDKREAAFGLADVFMFAGLVFGIMAIARVLIAH